MAYSETPKAGVSGIRFVDAMDGYLYGPDLYVTHDGGATWQKITLEGLPSPYAVTSLETNGRDTYLIVGYPNVIPSPTFLYISKDPVEPFIQNKFIFPTGSPSEVIANSYGAVITVNWRGGTTRQHLLHLFQDQVLRNSSWAAEAVLRPVAKTKQFLNQRI